MGCEVCPLETLRVQLEKSRPSSRGLSWRSNSPQDVRSL